MLKGDAYEGNELQLPALFMTDKDLKVCYAHYGKNIMDMPTVDELIEMISQLDRIRKLKKESEDFLNNNVA